MEQMFRLLFAGLLGGLWLSLEEANCQDLDKGISTTSHCYNTSSGKTCFTILLVNGSHPVRKPVQTARNCCNSTVPGSSLIIINSLEILRNVESFIGRQELSNETIITDAQKLPSNVRFQWSWVNGNATIPINVITEQLPGIDGACVESKHGQSLAYCTGVSKSQYRYICEYSDSKSASNFGLNSKSYVASEVAATWYDARKQCLHSKGDLASITNLQTTENWSQLKIMQTHRYWIGLHRNKWIWNSTDAALTYTNWEGGYPDEFSDNQCVCINPQCRRKNDTTICENDRKWWSCNCNNDHAIVCQKQEETSGAATAEIDVIGKTLSSTTKDFQSSVSRSVNTTTSSHSSSSSSLVFSSTSSTEKSPSQPRTTSKKHSSPKSNRRPTTRSTTGDISRETGSSSSMTQIPPIYISESQTRPTALEPSSTGLFDSFSRNEILLILALFVAVVFIIVAVILIIRKRRYGRRNEGSPMTNTKQSEAVSPVYATVVPDNRPSEGTVPPDNTIYAEVEMTKQPTPPTSSTIYASVQPTSEAVDTGKSLVYADLDFPQKDQQKPSSADKITASLSSNYSQPCKPPTSASNTLHAEPTYLEAAIDVDHRATQDPSALYAEPMKLKKSP